MVAVSRRLRLIAGVVSIVGQTKCEKIEAAMPCVLARYELPEKAGLQAPLLALAASY